MSAAMLKLLGGGCLILAGMLLGGSAAAQKRREAQTLRRLSAALGVMEGELLSLCTPLPDIFRKLHEEKFFALLDAGFGTVPTEQLWRTAAASLELEPACAAALRELGTVIGRYDAVRQANEIRAVRSRLDMSAAAAERELAERGRRLPGLGAALGAMAAVLLF